MKIPEKIKEIEFLPVDGRGIGRFRCFKPICMA